MFFYVYNLVDFCLFLLLVLFFMRIWSLFLDFCFFLLVCWISEEILGMDKVCFLNVGGMGFSIFVVEKFFFNKLYFLLIFFMEFEFLVVVILDLFDFFSMSLVFCFIVFFLVFFWLRVLLGVVGVFCRLMMFGGFDRDWFDLDLIIILLLDCDLVLLFLLLLLFWILNMNWWCFFCYFFCFIFFVLCFFLVF